jgi:hypothetical protein
MRICTGNPAGIAFVLAAALSACSGGNLSGSIQPGSPAATATAPLSPPPVDLAGAWQLAAAAGGTCIMNFANGAADSRPDAPAAAPGSRPGEGTIAPEGGCPGNFFTSRQWTFEAGMLIIRDFRNQPLAQLSYSGAGFQGQDARLGALTLSKRM